MGKAVALRKVTLETEFGGGDDDDGTLVCPECEGETFRLIDHDGIVVVTCANPDCECEVWDIEGMDLD